MNEWKDNHMYALCLEELVFCACLKSSNSMIVLHPKLLWRCCYHATRGDVLKPRTNLSISLKQIQCKSCSPIAKLTALLFVYLRRLLHTHTHTNCAQEMYYKVTLPSPQHDNCASKIWGMNNHELETHTHTHTSCQKTHNSQNRLKWEHSSINEGSFIAYY
jgi:hypothetical protein